MITTFDLECIPNSPFPDDPKAEKAHRNESKNPTTARIVSIVASYWHPERWAELDTFIGYEKQNERRLLERFDAWRQKHDDHVWCGHNILGYDCPTTMLRAMVYGLNGLAKDITPTSRWGDRRHIDTMRLFGPSQRYVSLASIAQCLGIPHGSPDGGSKVYDWWLQGDGDNIQQHGLDDLKAQNALVMRLYEAGVLAIEPLQPVQGGQ